MKDDDWADVIFERRLKGERVSTETYQDFHETVKEVSDEELDHLLTHVNEEHRRRQKERVEKLHSMLDVRKEMQG